MVGAGIALVALGADGAMAFDDWLFLGSRRDVLREDGLVDYLLRSHNDHLMAGPVAWHHTVAAVFGITDYLPWIVCVAALHVSLAFVVRQLLHRLGVRPTLAAVLALLLMFWGPATGALLWGLDAVFAVSAGLFLVQLLLVRREDIRWQRAALAAGVGLVAITVHTTAVVGILAVVAMLVLGRRWRHAVVVASPLLVYGAWYLTYRQRDPVYLAVPGAAGDPATIPASIPTQLEFGVHLLASPFGALLPTAVSLAALVVAIGVAWRVAGRRDDHRRPLLIALTLFLVMFTAATAHSRAGGGTRYAAEDRFVAALTLTALPFLALALQQLGDVLARRSERQVGAAWVAGLVGVLAVANGAAFREDRHDLHRAMHFMEDEVLAVAGAPDLDQRSGTERVFPFLWDLTVDHVRHLVDDGLLPNDDQPNIGSGRYVDPFRAGHTTPRDDRDRNHAWSV